MAAIINFKGACSDHARCHLHHDTDSSVGLALARVWYFMGELTAQVKISEFSNRKAWYENERVCGID